MKQNISTLCYGERTALAGYDILVIPLLSVFVFHVNLLIDLISI